MHCSGPRRATAEGSECRPQEFPEAAVDFAGQSKDPGWAGGPGSAQRRGSQRTGAETPGDGPAAGKTRPSKPQHRPDRESPLNYRFPIGSVHRSPTSGSTGFELEAGSSTRSGYSDPGSHRRHHHPPPGPHPREPTPARWQCRTGSRRPARSPSPSRSSAAAARGFATPSAHPASPGLPPACSSGGPAGSQSATPDRCSAAGPAGSGW